MPKTILITGASDGIGAAAARALVERGHRVVVIGRSPEKTSAVAEELGVPSHCADFTHFADVRRLAREVAAAYDRIDVLANNAGGICGERQRTVDGFEWTFQVNHLAPFLLTRLLMPVLVASRATVIQTSSAAARLTGQVDLADLEHASDFTPERAYGTAKLANILFTIELDRRYGGAGVSAAAFHPGVVASNFASTATGLARHLYGSSLARRLMRSVDAGAAQLVWLAEGTPGKDWQSGGYYEKFRRARRVHPQVKDPEVARRLWECTEVLLGEDEEDVAWTSG